MKKGFARWKHQITVWRTEYGSPRFKKGEYDPSKIAMSSGRCAKCGSTRDLARHHKGHEYFFACIWPAAYAARYIEFRTEDCVVLCTRGRRCHQRIHKLYEKILKELWAYVQDRLDEIVYDDSGLPNFKWRHPPEFASLEGFRLRMVSRCDQWLLRKNKKYKPSSYRSVRDSQI